MLAGRALLNCPRAVLVRSSPLAAISINAKPLVHVHASTPTTITTSRPISVSPDKAMQYLAGDKHSHTRDWLLQRASAVALLVAFPMVAVCPGFAVDTAIAVVGVYHAHTGMQAVFADYAHGYSMRRAFDALLTAASCYLLGVLLYFNYSDVGICQAVRQIWSI